MSGTRPVSGPVRIGPNDIPPALPSHAELVRAFTGREVQVEGKTGGPGVVLVESLE